MHDSQLCNPMNRWFSLSIALICYFLTWYHSYIGPSWHWAASAYLVQTITPLQYAASLIYSFSPLSAAIRLLLLLTKIK